MNKSNNEFMTIIEEDKGTNEIFKCSFDIDIKLNYYNYIVI